MAKLSADILQGARNLLENCAGMRKGQTLLILHEGPDAGIYDGTLAGAIAKAAETAGIRAELEEVPFAPQAADPSPALARRMAAADRTLFLARLGDQIRFRPSMGPINPVVSYALDAEMLGSGFGQAHFGGLLEIKALVNSALATAGRVRVTCPLGTDFSGPGVRFPAAGGDCTITRFPMSVFTPAPASGFAGRVAQAGFLVGTGSHYYEPYAVALEDVLLVEFDGTRIVRFEGSRRDAQTARRHYETVGARFGIDPWFVHSWHAGIHPGCAYRKAAAENVERWETGAFGNPRILHLHTCGDYPPGEISLNVIDPTVEVDGIRLWDQGRLCPERIPGGQRILDRYPCLARIFADPETEVGLGPDGRLTLVRDDQSAR